MAGEQEESPVPDPPSVLEEEDEPCEVEPRPGRPGAVAVDLLSSPGSSLLETVFLLLAGGAVPLALI
jgi:hypothetical protein